jgi:hypothetical protein
MAKPSAAAPSPMATILAPIFHHDPTPVSAEYTPTPKSTTALSTTASTSAGERARRNGKRGGGARRAWPR